MITVEFTGPSGSGKSTLIAAIKAELSSKGIVCVEPLHSIIGDLADRISDERVKVLLLELLILPWTIVAALKYSMFLRECWHWIRESGVSIPRACLLLRSVLRKLGVHYYSSCRPESDSCLLIDEGTIHAAHVIFLNGGRSVDKEVLEQFAQPLRLFDKVIFLTANKAILKQRVLARSDKPIRDVDDDFLCRFVENAHDLFEGLYTVIENRCPTYRVDFSESSSESVRHEAQKAAKWIMSK